MALVVKNLPANAGDVGLIPGSGRSRGEGNGNLEKQRSLVGYSPWVHIRHPHAMMNLAPFHSGRSDRL